MDLKELQLIDCPNQISSALLKAETFGIERSGSE
jgi:hypothetical protein